MYIQTVLVSQLIQLNYSAGVASVATAAVESAGATAVVSAAAGATSSAGAATSVSGASATSVDSDDLLQQHANYTAQSPSANATNFFILF